jgi:D-alanyl-D-alanine carboxypeptidase (penicillin-binding protein 5/6)
MFRTARQIICLFCVMALFSLQFAAAAPNLAKQALIYDYDSEQVLMSINGYKRMMPSSMTKLMTVYIVFDQLKKGHISLDTKFRVSHDAWAKGGSKMFLRHNDLVRVEDLLLGAIVQSGNDACITLAEGLSGTVEIFVATMNEYGEQMGLQQTNFTNPTGWPDNNHYSTAYDIALLSAKIIRDFPEYYKYFSERNYTHNGITQWNRNVILGKYGVDGLKTGHTEDGGYGVAVSAKMNGRRIVAVVNGLETMAARASAAEKLVQQGLNNYKNKKVYSKDEDIIEIPVWFGKEQNVKATVTEDILVTLPNKNSHYKVTARYDSIIPAPIKSGDKVGELEISYGSEQKKIVSLVAKHNVEGAGLIERMRQNIVQMVSSVF